MKSMLPFYFFNCTGKYWLIRAAVSANRGTFPLGYWKHLRNLENTAIKSSSVAQLLPYPWSIRARGPPETQWSLGRHLSSLESSGREGRFQHIWAERHHQKKKGHRVLKTVTCDNELSCALTCLNLRAVSQLYRKQGVIMPPISLGCDGSSAQSQVQICPSPGREVQNDIAITCIFSSSPLGAFYEIL